MTDTEKEQLQDDYYKNEGMVIYVKGRLFYGIHPDNLLRNIDALIENRMGFDWAEARKLADGTYPAAAEVSTS